MALTLLRHTTPQVAAGVCYGVTDLDLAESFEQEAEAVLSELPDVAAIVCSPLLRCRRLAERIGLHLSREVLVSTDWREMDFGVWEGQGWSDLPRAELDAWAADFHDYAGHGGESVAALHTRVRQGLAAAPDGALIVTHMGCIKAALVERGDADGWNARLPFGGMVRV
ncbi:histidine phosphatase family protein [Pacificoceanicola onchidii]|uniref:histidine phosphatase family protein n=1 Tax=Pacificoceanicola onchidii TaxID=2562685 RepID=UPI0014561904|nr:histidine phosphatase family protein [Pacificoceanicola onchidii]